MKTHFKNLHSSSIKKRLLSFASVALPLVSAVFSLNVETAEAQSYTNPVIPGIADAGCIKYAGKYYLGGVAT